MPLFATTYTYAPEHAEARERNRPAHRAWLTEQAEAGRILTVGPFPDGGGALLVVSADSAEAARKFVGHDPHLEKGLVADVTVREWMPVIGAFA